MIPNGKRLNYLAVKKLPALLRVITSKNNGDFFILLGQKANVNPIKKCVKIKIFVMLLCLLKSLNY